MSSSSETSGQHCIYVSASELLFFVSKGTRSKTVLPAGCFYLAMCSITRLGGCLRPRPVRD